MKTDVLFLSWRRRESVLTEQLAIEHGVFMRQIGSLQRRTSDMLRASAAREDALRNENLRLRAQLVLLRTVVVWGLQDSALKLRPAPPARRPVLPDPALRLAREVICQTGCLGHAHPWLDEEGQCRQSGQPCGRLE